MSLKGSAQEQDSLKDEIQQQRSELQLMMMEERQASMMHDMRDMMAEFMGGNGRSEPSSAEVSAAVRENPRGAGPIAVREASAAAGGVARVTTAGTETTLREDAARNFGVLGRRGTAVPVEVGPARVLPGQPRRAGEWDAYPRGELGGG